MQEMTRETDPRGTTPPTTVGSFALVVAARVRNAWGQRAPARMGL